MRLASIWAIWVFLDISHDFPTIFFVIFFVISQLEIFFTWILFPLTCSCMLVSNLVGFYQVGRDVCCSLHLTHETVLYFGKFENAFYGADALGLGSQSSSQRNARY